MARIAVIMDNMFEDDEFKVPYQKLREAGHEPIIVGLEAHRELTGLHGTTVTTEMSISDVLADDFDAIAIPGGYSPDKIRTNKTMISFVRKLYKANKPIAAVCHAPWILAEANIARGHTVTTWPSIKTDLLNAGAQWVDQEVIVDNNIITSRKPDDLPAFAKALIQQLT